MKTLKLFVLPVIALSICTYYVFAQTNSPAPHEIKLSQPKELKAGREDAAHFEKVLNDHHALYYCMNHHKNKDANGEAKDTPLKKETCPRETTSVIVPADGADRELTLICSGAHITQRAGFSSAQDKTAVMAEFK